MPQSLLALLAILAASILTLQHSRDRVQDMTAVYRSDAVVQARGIAVEVMERLSGYPFDGGEGGDAGGSGTAVYSPDASFGTAVSVAGQPLAAVFSNGAFDDLDDFDGAAGMVATVTVFDPASATTDTLSFEVAIEVAYAEASGGDWGPAASAATRTPFKRAAVSVDHATFPTPVRLGRIYAAD